MKGVSRSYWFAIMVRYKKVKRLKTTNISVYCLQVESWLTCRKFFTRYISSSGLGSALGFAVDGIDWEHIFSYQSFGFQLKVVYFCAVVVFLLTAAMTLLSIKVFLIIDSPLGIWHLHFYIIRMYQNSQWLCVKYQGSSIY